ncbi:Spy0128 family protein [Collinsella aerofaciens]|uniref:Spy0128 family protein n=1 Tax=Collinsella aerofaciens TaxID=74426 RepID=UPI00189CF38E|nr:FctA domain-containing protein [Collinsella aerofaciens]
MTVPLAACALMFGATSASADQTVPYSNHTVETVNPTGTTVNLFDYWVVDGDNDNSANVNNYNENDNTGINKDHQLKFNGGAGTGINKWTGRSGTAGYGRLRFVENQLVNGYPAIKKGTYTSQGNGVNYTDESLAYLFNNASQANGKQKGKAVYNNVQGLFQLKDGYYVYDSYGSNGSNGNYAVYNSTTNSFDVYDKAGVYKGDASKETNLGQFFPFDSASKVFDEQGNNLSPKKIVDGSTDLNHHFGMSMTTEFVQPASGKTTKNEDMIFEFSGDDDVWVYIDGVLVGDLGGIHEKATLKINFATGAVHVGHIDNANDAEKTIKDTTIRAMFEAAGADTKNFRDNTFRDSTKHKLSFFYLERGAGASNMSLKFNLTTLPSSEVEKVDQNGQAVQGATFALYQSDEKWTVPDGAEPIAQGTTDAKGQLVLLKSDGSVLSFDEEHNAHKSDYYVLKEISLPAGYRSSLTSSTSAKSGELHLQYKEAASGTGGVVVAPETTVTTADGTTQWTGSRMWLNGGYLAAKETISLNKDIKDNKNKPINSGTTFAVVLKRTDANGDHTSEDSWTAVTGNPLKGYKLCSAHGIAGAVEAAQSKDTSVFAVNTKGDYEVTVRSLPGDIETYAAMMKDKSNADYTVAVYHTTASSLAGATTDNTSMVEYKSTSRQFSTVIHLTNVQNRLFVQKVDDLGKPVNGATFELYQAKDVTGDSPKTYAIKSGAEPYDTVQANGMTYPYDIEGAACFPLDSTKQKPLIKGTYYLRESVSPDGYEINNTITKVIVDDSGVYVDAGEKGDDVLSLSGPGSLIASLAQFGSPDSIDNTLTHIKGKLQSATGADVKGNLTWGQTSTAEGVTPSLENDLMHMRYDKAPQGTKTVLRYVEDKGVRDGQLATIFADTGINRMALYQESDSTYIEDASKTRTDLGTLQLNHLFTTATAVQYTDRRVARLQVTKTVTADDGLTAPAKDADGKDLTFTFKFTLPESEKGYEAQVFDANGKPTGKSFKLKNGYTHSIKAGETIRVYDLKQGDEYSVSELTTKGESASGNVLASIVNTVTGSAGDSVLPAGFSLVSRRAGGVEQSGPGNTITGKIGKLEGGEIPKSNKLEFTNNYSASSVTLDAKDRLSVKKRLNGRNWNDSDTFTVQLAAKDGAPMPNGAKSQVSTVEITEKAPTEKIGDITYKTATFGDITYTKPDTYTYTISEVIPGSDAGAGGISYSAASYTATIVVEDNHAGALFVKSVTVMQERNDAGAETKKEVTDRVATFTNRYDEHEKDIIIHAQKNLTDKAGTFKLAQSAFGFTLEGLGGYTDASVAFDPTTVDANVKAPMPQGAEGNFATVGNNADGTVTWPAISYTARADAGHAYVYKFVENPGSVAGMTYDGSVYYAVVRNAAKGAGMTTSIEYYKAAADGSVKQLDKNVTPSFTNSYSVKPASVTLQGQKTLSGRDWNQGESYTFNLTAATDDADTTGLSKTTKQAVTDGAVAINTNQADAGAPESGRVASFAFGAEAAPTVTFNRAGTFSFNITENAAQDGQAGMSMDKHTARATVVVTDLDESGKHTGKLVSSVTYTNTDASDADKAVTDKAAFTNAYHASGTFGGVTVSKTLQGRASAAGQFAFVVTGLWYNGVQTSVDGAEANLSNKAAKAGVSGAVVGASGAEKLFARKLTEQDLGHTFAYRIHENQPATAAGYTYDTGYTGDAIVLVKVLARKDDPAKLYTVTTVLKGAGVTELLGDGADASALTDEKIVELKQDSHTYVQQYDASETGATTPTVSFVNRYTASLDYGTAGGIQIEKTLTYPEGATVFGSPKSTFRYIVKPADETSASKVGISTNGKVFETANVEANAPKTVSLMPAGGLTFNQDDAGKTFTYTVSEIDDKATGYTYDETVHTVRAVVADNGDGTLRVTTSVSKQVDGKDELEGQWIYPSDATSTGVATVKFKNTYTVAEAATYTPSVTKVVAGANAPDKFTFAMTAADDVTKAAIDGKLITGSSMSAENGYAEKKQTKEGLKDGEHYQLDFSKLTFNKPGTYKFAINEVAANSGLGEWKYDQHVYTVTVTVTDEGGKLVARADGTTGSEGFIFTNSYQTSTSYELQGGLEIVKTLNGHDLHAGMFGFTVTGEDDASIEKLNKLLRADEGKLTVTNDEPQADGTSHTGILGGLTFATGDADKTFAYKIVENGGGRGGYTYDSTYWKVEIAVKKRDNGSLYTVTTVKHYDANDVEEPRDANTFSSESGTAKAQVSFTNSYIATGTFDGLAAEKVMDSGDKIEAGQYTFDLYAEKTDGSLEKMDEGKTQASDNGIATVDFGKVNFKLGGALGGSHELTDLAAAVADGFATKQHNADHTTTYSFNLVAKERLANLPEGVRPVDTSATCRVLLEVTDNNNGKLTSKVTYRNGTENGKIVFHNTRDKVKTIGTVAKPDVDIDGQLLSVGDSYVYTINWVNTEADANGNLVPANVTVTDKLPAGVVFEAFEGECADKGAASGQSLTWDLGKQPAGSHGSVRVRVKITEDAVEDAQGAVGTVKNAATITVGNKSYTGTTTNYVPKKSESDAQDSKGSGVKLGDELTYTIGYKNTENKPATVTISDTVPAGTEFVEFAGDHKDVGSKDSDGNLTWTLADVPAGKEGTVQFKVRVTEDAFKSGGASDDISNQASVAVGNNPAVKTNTTTDDVSDGRLTLSKTVKTAEGIVAPNKAFTFKVLLYQADGTTPLAGTFAYAGRPSGTNGTYVSGQIKSGGTIALNAGGSVTVTVPVGAHYEVQELDSKGNLMTSEDGFAVADKANTQKGIVGQATQVGFTNIYSVESTKVENAFKVQKKISGRNWTTSDAFTMTLTAQGEAPMPKGAQDGVSTIALSKDVQVGNFGTIEYTKPGTYTYVIAEQAGDETALTFSKATYRATVTVTDNGTGKLTAKTKIAQLTDDAGNTAERTVEAAVFTNTAKTGSLTVKKTVVGGDGQREFGFTVALTDGDGEPVSGTFGKGDGAVTFTDGRATFTLKHGGEKTITGLPVGASYTVTEDAAEGYTTTAEGAKGTVTEAGATVAFTNTYGTATEGRDVSTAGLFTKTLKGRDWAEGDSFQFTLTGEDDAPMPEGSVDGSKTVSVTAAAGTEAGTKVAFDFGSIRYTLNDIKDAGFAEVGGKRVRAKTFTYTVREAKPDDGSAIAGVSYDGRVATMTVTVTDDGSGNLTASTPAIAQVSGGDFVNTYTTELDYSARAGVRLSKTLSGRAMEAGQFAFTVTADDETAAKLGLKTGKNAYAVAAADDGEAAVVDLIGGAAKGDVTFTDADAGKTYSFTVAETKLGGDGYTNDTEPRTVTIALAYDATTGELTVTTTVVKDGVEVARSEVSTADDTASLPAPVTVAFQNSYEATGTLGGEGSVAIDATKTLTGRAAAAGEFSFSVRDAHGNVVATASNRASGDGEVAELAFSPISYTTDELEQMVVDGTATRADDGSWTIPYTVSEDTAALPAGVTATASSFDITVKATDNGKGGLDVAVAYPEGSDGKLSFVNGYGTNEATVDLAGTKTLALGQAGLGLTQADIEGKYTFKIEPLDGAPAPADASGKTVTEAVNDAAGNVELGSVTFRQPSDLDDVEIDGDGLRTKTFAYRVSESGSVDGVTNDAVASRTFTVKVVEDTNTGTLAAKVLPAEGTPEGKGAFEFTNTYGVDPAPSSVTDQIKVNKKLKGRDLAEGEFEFQLIEISADGSESVAAMGKNAADGTVALGPVTYTAPGTHSYELREVAGTAGGVTYDRAAYRVRTTVTDAGDGTLTVKHELTDAEGNPTGDDSVTFTNGYKAAPVTLKLGAAKVLKGAELKAGQFSFELKGRDGKVMSTAKNAADGSVTFGALTFKQAGTYTFTVSEVDDGQAHVTYDKAVRKIVVTVSDEAADGSKTGYLSAKVSYEGDADVPPVFTNSYAEEPETPGTPENPGTPGGGSGGGSDSGSGSGGSGDGSKGGMPDTGDRSLPVEALAAMAGIGALAVAGGAALYRRRR